MNEKSEFHVPFIKSLVFVAMVTVVSAGIVHYFSNNRFFESSNSQVFTSSQSQNSTESPQQNLMVPISH